MLFRVGIAADLVMLLADLVVAWALYLLFEPLDRPLSTLAAWARIAQAATIAGSLVSLMLVGRMLGIRLESGDAWSKLEAHRLGYVVGLAFFAIACMALGRILFRTGVGPRVLGALLILAGIGYLFDTFGHIAVAEYPNTLSMAVLLPAFVAEFWFCGWLLVLGFGKSDMSNFVRRSADE